jgi:hypothetical protein
MCQVQIYKGDLNNGIVQVIWVHLVFRQFQYSTQDLTTGLISKLIMLLFEKQTRKSLYFIFPVIFNQQKTQTV